MARSDLLCQLIEAGLQNDRAGFIKAVKAISADERSQNHEMLAEKLEKCLKDNDKDSHSPASVKHSFSVSDAPPSGNSSRPFFQETVPRISLNQLMLPDRVLELSRQIIDEQQKAGRLRSYGIEPRSRVLLSGPPGNGKTSLAEAFAEALMLPLVTVRYDALIGSYSGETSSRLTKLFEYASSKQCVLFFDEFDVIGNERGGKKRGEEHETSEIPRVVCSLLLDIDTLPSHVLVIAATNNNVLPDHAVWRRFQVKMELPRPDTEELENWFSSFEKRMHFSFKVSAAVLAEKFFGRSYAEAEEFAMSVFRQSLLKEGEADNRVITLRQLWLYGCDDTENGRNNELDEGGRSS
ncbi:AAA family ATPase [Succinimonas sp.]|uniref:AAA family ATPase n=1 Tax=Succinimonas sp. TaxID=1936151 RepID=UPI003869D269